MNGAWTFWRTIPQQGFDGSRPSTAAAIERRLEEAGAFGSFPIPKVLGCFCKLEVLFVEVLPTRALLFGLY